LSPCDWQRGNVIGSVPLSTNLRERQSLTGGSIAQEGSGGSVRRVAPSEPARKVEVVLPVRSPPWRSRLVLKDRLLFRQRF